MSPVTPLRASAESSASVLDEMSITPGCGFVAVTETVLSAIAVAGAGVTGCAASLESVAGAAVAVRSGAAVVGKSGPDGAGLASATTVFAAGAAAFFFLFWGGAGGVVRGL